MPRTSHREVAQPRAPPACQSRRLVKDRGSTRRVAELLGSEVGRGGQRPRSRTHPNRGRRGPTPLPRPATHGEDGPGLGAPTTRDILRRAAGAVNDDVRYGVVVRPTSVDMPRGRDAGPGGRGGGRHPAPGGESGGAVGSGATSSRLQLGELAAGV